MVIDFKFLNSNPVFDNLFRDALHPPCALAVGQTCFLRSQATAALVLAGGQHPLLDISASQFVVISHMVKHWCTWINCGRVKI